MERLPVVEVGATDDVAYAMAIGPRVALLAELDSKGKGDSPEAESLKYFIEVEAYVA